MCIRDSTWAEAAAVWDEYQETQDIPADQRLSYDDYAFFANPYKRVHYAGTLRDYAEAAAKGRQSTLGLGKRCLVGPTQAFYLPDGARHLCGGHAVTRPQPVAKYEGAGGRPARAEMALTARILARLAELPDEFCYGCPVATLFINQTTEAALREQVAQWIAEALSLIHI